MKQLISVTFISLLVASCGNKEDEIHPLYKDITETVFASGTLEPEGKYNLTSQSDGYLISINFKEGDVVKTGDILAVVDNQPNTYNESSAEQLLNISQKNVSDNSPILKQTELNIQLAKEKVKQDEAQAARYKSLFESNSVSKLEYENAQLALTTSKINLSALEQTFEIQKQQAQQQLITQTAQKNVNSFLSNNNQIKAVVGGKVYKKMKEQGDYVKKGDVIAMIGNAENIYARLSIDESNISKIKLEQEALILLNTNKENSLGGKVYEILPAFEDATQSFICKVKFEKPLEFKVAGTQLQANIIIGKKAKTLVIPRAYLDYGNKVRVKGNDEPILIKTGFVSSEWVEVLEGLKPEDVLVSLNK